MTLEAFKKSADGSAPPKGIPLSLQAMWYEAKGNWEQAHELAQDDESPQGAWVHAHLHRKEGDLSNARYWYARAGKDSSALPLHKEWEHIAETLLNSESPKDANRM